MNQLPLISKLFRFSKALAISYCAITAQLSFAAIDTYQFSNDEQRDRFQQLTAELRCPKCQNQNIADSNAEIAHDLRAKIHQMLGKGHSDDDIVEYMIERYGDFVLYKPRLDKSTLALWYGPTILLLSGLIVVLILSYRSFRGTSQQTNNDKTLTDEQQQQLDSLLNNKSDKTP